MKRFFSTGSRTVATLLAVLVIAGALYLAAHSLFKKSEKVGLTYPFVLPPLPYTYKALEPSIDALTMELHHNKHHQKYVDELNAALKEHPEFHKKTLYELLTHLDELPESIRTAVRNNGGGHYNHSFFWKVMAPSTGQEPDDTVKEIINKHFKDLATFKNEFTAAAKKVFGSGWVWLCADKNGALLIMTTANQDSPITRDWFLCSA